MRFQLLGLPAARENNQLDDFSFKEFLYNPLNNPIEATGIISLDGEKAYVHSPHHADPYAHGDEGCLGRLYPPDVQ